MLRISIVWLLILSYVYAIDIRQAWDQTKQNNQGLKAQEYNIQRAEKMRYAARMSYLPQVDLVGFYTRLDNSIVFEPKLPPLPLPPAILHNPRLEHLIKAIQQPITLLEKNIIIGAAHAVMPLYTGGARSAINKIADIQIQDSKESHRLKQLAIFEELVKVYYGVLLHEELKTLLNEQEQNTYLHHQNAIKLKSAGQIAQVELLGTQVAYDKAKNAAKSAEDDLQIAQLTLDTLLEQENVKPTSTFHVQGILKDVDHYIDQTLLSYPALKNIHNKQLEAQQFSRVQTASFLPQIALQGTFMTTDQNSVIEKSLPKWYAGVVVRMPLLSHDGRIFKYQAAKIAELQASSLEAQAISDMRLLVQKTYKEAKAAKEQYESLQSSIDLAKENLSLQEKAFFQGIATQAQVNDARNMLLGALVEQKSIAYKYTILIAKLMALSNDIDGFFSIMGE